MNSTDKVVDITTENRTWLDVEYEFRDVVYALLKEEHDKYQKLADDVVKQPHPLHSLSLRYWRMVFIIKEIIEYLHSDGMALTPASTASDRLSEILNKDGDNARIEFIYAVLMNKCVDFENAAVGFIDNGLFHGGARVTNCGEAAVLAARFLGYKDKVGKNEDKNTTSMIPENLIKVASFVANAMVWFHAGKDPLGNKNG